MAERNKYNILGNLRHKHIVLDNLVFLNTRGASNLRSTYGGAKLEPSLS